MKPHLKSARRSTKMTRTARRHAMLGLERLESRQLLAGLATSPIYSGPIGGYGNPTGAPPFPLGQTFQLHSLPGAAKTIYLDFNGHVTTNTAWNTVFDPDTPSIVSPPFDSDGNANFFSDAELETIQRIWQRTAEDFIPFNVDVTTEFVSESLLTRDFSGDPIYGMRAAIGGTFDIIPGLGGAGGVAFLNSFGDANLSPAFVFSETQGNDEQVVTETISHEIGHTLGLNHDGTSQLAYYGGHGLGATSWGPIMGAAFGISVTHWDNGSYPDADNPEDDLSIITSFTNQNQFGYRPDIFGNTLATAAPFQLSSSGQGVLGGIIEQNTDEDWFRIDFPDGNATIDANSFQPGANLDIQLDLLDSAGTVLFTSSPFTSLDASITALLRAGTYYVRIQGVGKPPVPGDPGYSDYGSLGRYALTFDVDPSSHILGAAYLDGDGDGGRQPVDSPAIGFVVFIDDNLNGTRDVGESFTITDAAGGFDLLTVGGQRNVTMELPPGYFFTDPPSGVRTVQVPNNGGTVSGVVLGISGAKGIVSGRKILDNSGNGVFEESQGDRFLAGQFIYVDLDNDGRPGFGEPGAQTDANGAFIIGKVPIGRHTLREVLKPGFGVTAPTTIDGSYTFDMPPGGVITGLDFWNSPAADYGDAPNSYRTTIASNGPVHGYKRGFGLGSLLDADADGKPTAFAGGDDATFSDDEDGVVFQNFPSAGRTFRFTVTVMVPNATQAGYLNAWMDMNRDGDFLDAGEKIIGGRQLGRGTYGFNVNIPANAPLGLTFLRFRYGTEANIGFAGPAFAGEVEDYSISIFGNVPVANPDAVTVTELSRNNRINVLANDLRSSNGSLAIDASRLPATSVRGGRLTLDNNGTPNNRSDDFIRYDAVRFPGSSTQQTFTDSFVYTVTDGTNRDSATVTITIRRLSTRPIAVDDTLTARATGTTNLFITGNDIRGTDQGKPLTKVSLFSFNSEVKAESGEVIGRVTRNTNGTPNDLTDDTLTFTPTANAAGKTGQFSYVARNPNVNSPTGNPTQDRRAIVTVQVRGDNVVDSNDIVKLSIGVRETGADGSITSVIPAALVQGRKYWVGIFADDLRTAFDFQNNPGVNANGALSVYLDLLFNKNYVSPVRVSSGNGLSSLNIRYIGAYNTNKTGLSGDAATAGLVNELGVTSAAPGTPGPANTPVLFVQFVANAPTPGTSALRLWSTDPAEQRARIDPKFIHDVTVVNRSNTTQLNNLALNNIAYFHSDAFRVLPAVVPAPSTSSVAMSDSSTPQTTSTSAPSTTSNTETTVSTSPTKSTTSLDAFFASLMTDDSPYKKK